MSETGTTNPKGNIMKVKSASRADSWGDDWNNIRFDVSESTSVAALSVSKWDNIPNCETSVQVRFLSNEDITYIYKFTEATNLMYELLQEQSAGRMARWIKQNATETWKVPRDGEVTKL